MRFDSAIAILFRALTAISWLIYYWFISKLLSPADLGLVLLSLALAGVGAGIAASGWAQWLVREGSQDMDSLCFAWPDALRGTIWRLIFAAPLLAILAYLFGEEYLGLSPSICVMTIAILAAQSIVQVSTAGLRASGQLITALSLPGTLHILLVSSFLALLALGGVEPSPSIVLGIHLACSLLVALIAVRRLPNTSDGRCWPSMSNALTYAQIGLLLFQNIDVLLIGLFLEPSDTALYLVLRRISGLLGVLFEALRTALGPHLACCFRQRSIKEFRAIAARVNLGFMLIGSSAALFLLLFSRFIFEAFELETNAAKPVLTYLLIGQIMPSIFGATGMFMVMTNLESARSKILWSTSLLFICIYMITFPEEAVGFALIMMFAHTTVAVFSSIVVTRKLGVWPGLTALLHRQVRL